MRYSFVGALLLAVPVFAAVEVMDEIVCKANGDIITRTDLEKDRKQLENDLRTRAGLSGARLQDEIKKRMSDLLRNRIDQLLLVAKGKEMDLKVDTDVNKRMADLQRLSGMADPEKFQAYVKEQTGMSFEDYKAQEKNRLLTERVVGEEVSRKIQFKREDLEAYYNDHKDEFIREERVFLREILISTQGKDAAGIAAAEKKAKDLVVRARQGQKFPEMAQLNSDDPTAQDGGALDPYKKDEMRPEISAAVWDKEKGYVSDPINVGNAFIILKVDDHPKAGLAGFEEVQLEVQNKLYQPRFEPAYRAYLTKLRQAAYLEIKPGYEDSGAAPGKDTTWVDPAQLKPDVVTKKQVLEESHKKRLLGVIPIPGTTASKTGTSSSR
jgi:peptidyl-prolyl cis-trans isomerase SurA